MCLQGCALALNVLAAAAAAASAAQANQTHVDGVSQPAVATDFAASAAAGASSLIDELAGTDSCGTVPHWTRLAVTDIAAAHSHTLRSTAVNTDASVDSAAAAMSDLMPSPTCQAIDTTDADSVRCLDAPASAPTNQLPPAPVAAPIAVPQLQIAAASRSGGLRQATSPAHTSAQSQASQGVQQSGVYRRCLIKHAVNHWHAHHHQYECNQVVHAWHSYRQQYQAAASQVSEVCITKHKYTS